MNWARFSRRERMLGAAAAGSLTVILLIHFGWGCLLSRIDSLEKETIRLEKEITTSQAYLRREIEKQGEYEALLEGFTEKSADQDLMAQMLAAVQAEAQARKINVQELNSLPLNREDGWRSLRIKLTAGGSWTDLLEFFNHIQKAPQRFDVEDLVLDQAPDGGQSVRCQVTLRRWSLAAEPAP